MARRPLDYSLYFVTDRGLSRGRSTLEIVRAAVQGGVTCVQLREKTCSTREFIAEALSVKAFLTSCGVALIINDRVDIALAVGADGVHLPEAGLPLSVARELLGPTKLIGVSCHSLDTAHDAEHRGADFITFGPVWFTPSKARYGEPVGVVPLAGAVQALSIPVFALGGVTRDRVPELLAAGIRRVALISAILAAPAPRAEAEAFTTLLDKAA